MIRAKRNDEVIRIYKRTRWIAQVVSTESASEQPDCLLTLRSSKLFLEIMEQTIPTASLSARSNLPWLTKKAMRKQDILFKKKAYSLEYCRARNKVVGMVCKAKCNYFKRLDPKHTCKEVLENCEVLN